MATPDGGADPMLWVSSSERLSNVSVSSCHNCALFLPRMISHGSTRLPEGERRLMWQWLANRKDALKVIVVKRWEVEIARRK